MFVLEKRSSGSGGQSAPRTEPGPLKTRQRRRVTESVSRCGGPDVKQEPDQTGPDTERQDGLRDSSSEKRQKKQKKKRKKKNREKESSSGSGSDLEAEVRHQQR